MGAQGLWDKMSENRKFGSLKRLKTKRNQFQTGFLSRKYDKYDAKPVCNWFVQISDVFVLFSSSDFRQSKTSQIRTV